MLRSSNMQLWAEAGGRCWLGIAVAPVSLSATSYDRFRFASIWAGRVKMIFKTSCDKSFPQLSLHLTDLDSPPLSMKTKSQLNNAYNWNISVIYFKKCRVFRQLSTKNLNFNQNLCFVGSCPCLFLSQDFSSPSSTCIKIMLKKTIVLWMRMMLRKIETNVHLRKGPHVPAELQQASGQSSSEEHGLPGQKIQNHKITIDRWYLNI